MTSWLNHWRQDWTLRLVLFVVCSILLIWIFRSEVAAAIEVWSASQTFGHAFFIFPITLFLFYRLRHRLAALQPAAAPWVLVPMAGLTLVWMIGDLANLLVLKQFAFLALWQSLFLLVFGRRIARVAIFPLVYLYLAVPFGISVIPTLQDITAQIVVHLLRFTGIPVFLDGYYIEIPGGSFLIAEACSGVRYLIVCIAIGILAANLFFRSWRRRLLFVGLSVLVPIVANGVRAYGIVMLAYLSHYTLAVDVDHIIYGFIFLGVVMLALLSLGALLRDRHHSLLLDADNAVSQTFGAVETGALGRFMPVLYAGLAMMAIFLVQVWTTGVKAPPADLAATLHPPAVDSPWVADRNEAPRWRPEYRGMDAKLQQSYRRGQELVDLNIAYYVYQREGAEAVSDLNTIASERGGLKVLGANQVEIPLGGRFLPVNALVIRHRDQTFLVWYWFWIGGENTNSRLSGKLLEMKSLAVGGERAAAIIAVSAEVSQNVEGAAALLEAFLQQSLNSNGTLFQVEMSSARAGTSERETSSNHTGTAKE